MLCVALVAVFTSALGATAGSPPLPSQARLFHGAALQRASTYRDESTSVNWAGYVITGTTFSHVQATWVHPRVECKAGRRTQASSFWIGLGGASPGSVGLEQTGTSADCVRGRPRYYAWYEILPAPATTIDFSIRPGDTVTASVDVAEGVVSFSLQNLTNGAVFRLGAPINSAAVESAEWIAEAPSVCLSNGDCETLPLARFGSVLFTSAAATSGVHTGTIADAGWALEAIRLASTSGPFSAAPSVLSPDGSTFHIATHGPHVKLPRPLAAAPLSLWLASAARGPR